MLCVCVCVYICGCIHVKNSCSCSWLWMHSQLRRCWGARCACYISLSFGPGLAKSTVALMVVSVDLSCIVAAQETKSRRIGLRKRFQGDFSWVHWFSCWNEPVDCTAWCCTTKTWLAEWFDYIQNNLGHFVLHAVLFWRHVVAVLRAYTWFIKKTWLDA